MLILLRHGQTTSNVDRALDTQLPGAPLTELGQQQAREVGPEIMDLYNPSAVITSEALRARQTGELAFDQYFPHIPAVPGLQEIAAGHYEMHNTDDAHMAYHGVVHTWFSGDHSTTVPGGENLAQFMQRYRTGVADLKGKDAVVVTHGAAIRAFATQVARIDAEFATMNPLPNCRFVVLDPTAGEFGSWELVRWGDS